jgi:hypothetical protein
MNDEPGAANSAKLMLHHWHGAMRSSLRPINRRPHLDSPVAEVLTVINNAKRRRR